MWTAIFPVDTGFARQADAGSDGAIWGRDVAKSYYSWLSTCLWILGTCGVVAGPLSTDDPHEIAGADGKLARAAGLPGRGGTASGARARVARTTVKGPSSLELPNRHFPIERRTLRAMICAARLSSVPWSQSSRLRCASTPTSPASCWAS